MWRSLLKDRNLGVKLGVSLLFFVLGFTLLHRRFFDYSPLLESTRNNSTSVEINQENADQIQPQGLIFFYFNVLWCYINLCSSTGNEQCRKVWCFCGRLGGKWGWTFLQQQLQLHCRPSELFQEWPTRPGFSSLEVAPTRLRPAPVRPARVSPSHEEQKLGLHWGLPLTQPCPILPLHALHGYIFSHLFFLFFLF